MRDKKFASFDSMIEKCRRDDVDILVVAWPKVLGDNYEELLTNLEKVADAGLMLVMTGTTPEGY